MLKRLTLKKRCVLAAERMNNALDATWVADAPANRKKSVPDDKPRSTKKLVVVISNQIPQAPP